MERIGGVGWHVLTDNDECRQHTLTVPSGAPQAALKSYVAFDRPQPGAAWETRRLQDGAVFAAIPARVAEESADLPLTPPTAEHWRHAREALQVTPLLRDAFGHARRHAERDLNIANAEIPLSTLCRHPVYHRFVAELLCRAEEFHEIHQRLLNEYRREHGIASRHHPVADLAIDGGAVETPFWTWSPLHSKRRRLFVSRRGRNGTDAAPVAGGALLFDGDRCKDPEAVAARLAASTDVVVRPRALMNTAFLRLFLADLFIHGIGGGLYDVLTDRIVREFFGVRAADYVVVTATLRLPVDSGFRCGRWRKLQRERRDLDWNPDRHLPEELREHEAVTPVDRRKV